MVAPTRPLAGTATAVEPATAVVIGGCVDPEQPTTANKIVASTSGAPPRSRAATTRLRHTGSLPSTASESDALWRRRALHRSLCRPQARDRCRRSGEVLNGYRLSPSLTANRRDPPGRCRTDPATKSVVTQGKTSNGGHCRERLLVIRCSACWRRWWPRLPWRVRPADRGADRQVAVARRCGLAGRRAGSRWCDPSAHRWPRYPGRCGRSPMPATAR